MNWKFLLIIIILIIIGCIFPWQINRHFIERKLDANLEDRTLLIVIENNFMILPEIEKGYEDHKNLAETFFSYIFKVNKKELNNIKYSINNYTYPEMAKIGRTEVDVKEEGIDFKIKIITLPDKCVGCNECVGNCLYKALQFTSDGLHRDTEACTFCQTCIKTCPALAHEPTGR